MPREKVIQLYKFNELDERAKEKAREWYTRSDYPHDGWWDYVYEDFQTICDIIGVELDTNPVRLMNGKKVQKPQIYFSGFWSQGDSQGDGACFAGTYRGEADACQKIREHAPQDTELHGIVDALDVDWVQPYGSTRVDVTTSGRYCHSGTMRFDFDEYEDSEGELHDPSQERCEIVKDNLRWLADWLYRQLEKSYEWYTSEEVVDEGIIANEYEFDEHGNPA